VRHKFLESWSVKPDAKRNSTYVGLKISLSEDGQDFRHINWENYYRDCHKSLQAAARKHGLEIIVWTVEMDESYTSVSHLVTLRGILYGALPLQIMRALRPCRAYRFLGFLESAVRKDWRVQLFLNRLVESEKLHRCDYHGDPLADPIPLQLLMRAITEAPWQCLISPADKPWAYINTATQRISERHYQTGEKPYRGIDPDKRDATETGDGLHIADTPRMLQDVGVGGDAIAVLKAKAEGRRSLDIQSHLADSAGNSISARKAKARRELRTKANTMYAAAMAASTWRPRSSSDPVYRERLPDGKPWGGLWTFAHTLQGEDLELMRQIVDDERKNLYRH
jgi:hypothetical protein